MHIIHQAPFTKSMWTVIVIRMLASSRWFFYLNNDWSAEAGGELLMHGEGGQPLFSVSPKGGTLLLFTSEDMPHEVRAATRERWSIAGWFRRCE